MGKTVCEMNTPSERGLDSSGPELDIFLSKTLPAVHLTLLGLTHLRADRNAAMFISDSDIIVYYYYGMQLPGSSLYIV